MGISVPVYDRTVGYSCSVCVVDTVEVHSRSLMNEYIFQSSVCTI